jgi:purine nucleosidase
MRQAARTRRVIIDTDAKNEADDQYAIVHALLSPTLDIRGLIAAHFGQERSATSMLDSRGEIDLLLRLMGREGTVRVANGGERALRDESTPVESDGARLILSEAHSSEETLFVAFLGPLTDMASALLMEPRIATRDIVVVWIGGPPYGDKLFVGTWPEFNLRNDIAAANVVFGSGLQIWQVPASTYRMMNASYAELEEKVAPCGKLGRYLVDQLVRWNAQYHPRPIESRSLGDSPAVGLLLEPFAGVFREQPPVRFTPDGHVVPAETGSPIRVCEQIDSRFVLEDMFAKLKRWSA